MAENPTKDEQQTSDTNKYITLHLIGTPLTIAGAASTATSASYLVYEVVNHKKFIQTALNVIESYGVKVVEVGPDTIRIIASSENVAKIENAVKSSKLLEEINQRIVQYNEETKDKVQNLIDLKIWKSMKKKSKQNVDEVLEKGFRPYEIPESALLHRSTKRKPVNIQPTSSNQQARVLTSFPHNEEWLVCEGSFRKKIYYCTDSSGNNLFIKKIMYKPQHGNTAQLESFLRHCRTEVNNFWPLQESSYILKYITHEESGKRFEIITELCHGNVFEFVKCLSLRCEGKSSNEWPQPLPRVEKIPHLKEFANESDQDYLSFFGISPMEAVMQMIEGINVMHSADFVHQDIKPQNFLLKKWKTQTYVKVCDFGISKKLNEGSSTVRGTPSWMPPELLPAERAQPSLESDIFSLGLVLFYTLTNGKHPYGTLPFEQDSNIYKGTEPELQYLFEGDLSAEEKINACGLIYWMLSHKPEDRPTMEEVKCHPFLWNYDEKVEFLEKIGNLIANNKSAKDKDNTHAIKSSQAQPRSDIDEGNSSKPCSSESHTEGRVISEEQPIKTQALNLKEPTNLELLSQKFLKLESYPVWMSSTYWTSSGKKSNPTEQKKFNKTIQQIKELHEKMPYGKKPTESPNRIEQLLVTMRNKKQHCIEHPDKAEELGLGVRKNWKKFFQICTKDNPQILLNTYEVFKNEPLLQDFKEKMRRQDRGKRH